MQAEKHRRWDLGVDEVGHARDRAIERAQAEQRGGRAPGHERDREDVHDDQAGEEEEEQLNGDASSPAAGDEAAME